MTTNRENVIVVGATGAFGQKIVEKLSGEGCRLIAIARNKKGLEDLAARIDHVVPYVADLAEDGSLEQIGEVVGGAVRMIVHGPGVDVAGGVLEAPVSALLEAVNIKVGGLLRLVRAIDPCLGPKSRLVAIGGHYGFEPTAYAAAAGVANAALANVIRQLSLAYGPRGITAHLITPGPADTDRLRRVAADKAKTGNSSIEDVLQELRKESSIGALTTIEQVAWAVSLLLAPEADAMTGSALMLDSGRRRGLP